VAAVFFRPASRRFLKTSLAPQLHQWFTATSIVAYMAADTLPHIVDALRFQAADFADCFAGAEQLDDAARIASMFHTGMDFLLAFVVLLSGLHVPYSAVVVVVTSGLSVWSYSSTWTLRFGRPPVEWAARLLPSVGCIALSCCLAVLLRQHFAARHRLLAGVRENAAQAAQRRDYERRLQEHSARARGGASSAGVPPTDTTGVAACAGDACSMVSGTSFSIESELERVLRDSSQQPGPAEGDSRRPAPSRKAARAGEKHGRSRSTGQQKHVSLSVCSGRAGIRHPVPTPAADHFRRSPPASPPASPPPLASGGDATACPATALREVAVEVSPCAFEACEEASTDTRGRGSSGVGNGRGDEELQPARCGQRCGWRRSSRAAAAEAQLFAEPQLSAEHLNAELAAVELPSAQYCRWLDGPFRHKPLEELFRSYRTSSMALRVRPTLFLSTVVLWVLALLIEGGVEVPGFYWLSRQVQGAASRLGMVLVLTVVSAVEVASLLTRRRSAALRRWREHFDTVAIAAIVTILLIYTAPTIVRSLLGGDVLFDSSVNLTTSQVSPECAAQVEEATARVTRFYNLLSSTTLVMFHVFPAGSLATILYLLLHVSLSCWRYAVLWRAWYGITLPLPWTLLLEFALFADLVVALSSSRRKQFVLYWTVLRNAAQRAQRIEQLGEEKERLDYEARIASHAASLATAAARDDCASTCSSTACTPAHHIRVIGDAQPPSACSASSCQSSVSDEWPRAMALQIRAAGRDGRACQPRVEAFVQ